MHPYDYQELLNRIESLELKLQGLESRIEDKLWILERDLLSKIQDSAS